MRDPKLEQNLTSIADTESLTFQDQIEVETAFQENKLKKDLSWEPIDESLGNSETSKQPLIRIDS